MVEVISVEKVTLDPFRVLKKHCVVEIVDPWRVEYNPVFITILDVFRVLIEVLLPKIEDKCI